VRHPGPIGLSWLLGGLCVLSNIAWVLAAGALRDSLTVAGVLLFFAASLTHSLATRGTAWTARFFAICLAFGWAVEALGTATGWPFGEYSYADRLGPDVGAVPLAVPLAWAMMAYPVFVVVARTYWGRLARAALAAALLAAWDLFLDPQMVAEGHWVWAYPEPALPGIPGIPLTNFAGWIIAAAVLMTVLTLALPARAEEPVAQPAAMLGWVYAGNITANAVFLGRPGVALVGAAGMGAALAALIVGVRRAVAGGRHG
jgi:putative membrane protein